VLQNHQLTTELEYQSKQTEKLLFKNAKLQEQVTTLKRDVEIHKQVEAELAKRSHYAQSLIKKMSERIKELETENNHLKDPDAKNEETAPQEGYVDKNKDELITFLEKNLESTEKKLAKLQNDYDILKNEYDFMELKVEASNNKFANAAMLLKENLDMLMYGENKDEESLEAARRLALDLSEIKGKSIEELDSLQKQMLLNVLLEQIKPYLSKQTLANRLYEVDKMDNAAYQNRSGLLEPSQTQLPNIYEKSLETKIDQNKFHDVPLEISARIVRSNLRDWGKPVSMPSVHKQGRYKYKL
jgi:protein-tyrosine-phosphatase